MINISKIDEELIKRWKKQHIIDFHWEFSRDEKESIEKDFSQFAYTILPNKNERGVHTGMCTCNYCGEYYMFGDTISSELFDNPN